MKYPIIDENTVAASYPSTDACPVCGKKLTEKGFITLTGGVILSDKNGNADIGKDIDMELYLAFDSHNYEFLDGKKDFTKLKEQPRLSTPLVDVKSDEFYFFFCSSSCLRNWLNSVLDDIDVSIKEHFGYEP